MLLSPSQMFKDTQIILTHQGSTVQRIDGSDMPRRRTSNVIVYIQHCTVLPVMRSRFTPGLHYDCAELCYRAFSVYTVHVVDLAVMSITLAFITQYYWKVLGSSLMLQIFTHFQFADVMRRSIRFQRSDHLQMIVTNDALLTEYIFKVDGSTQITYSSQFLATS